MLDSLGARPRAVFAARVGAGQHVRRSLRASVPRAGRRRLSVLHNHLRPWALSLDERNFRVVLKDNRDASANRIFDDGSSTEALDDVIKAGLAVRVNAAGILNGPGARVLDLCAGRGHLGELLESEYGACVVFIDLSLAQLSELARRRRQHSARDVSACAGDLLNLPYTSG